MLFADRFAGHQASEDPRTLMFAGVGCPWPTRPAFRYRAISENATGEFTGFNGDGLFLPLDTIEPNFDDATWVWPGPDAPILECDWRHFQEEVDGNGYGWLFRVFVDCWPTFITKRITGEDGACNEDVLVGDLDDIPPGIGNTGDTLTLFQVEWDETEPPA